MTIEDLIISYRDTPLTLSVTDVARALFGGTICVATFDPHPPQGSGVFDGKTRLNFVGANDKYGRPWAYAYTSRSEYRKAFPQGRRGIEMRFEGFFPLIVEKPTFAGILFNAGSAASYLMPRKLFPAAQQARSKPADV